ncbi:MAG: 2-amino-4-hydroxy-6-hydroxymethyldihydropteridine diphosphokinase [Longimicrobiales bacterium]
MPRAFLGIGSSLDPEKNISAALGLLLGTPGVEITGISTFYRTPPLPAPGEPAESVARDPDFLNGVVEIRTAVSPERLAEILETIEAALGRVPTENRYAPRTLDLDLLLYDGTRAHPDIRSRPWVALPLLELDQDLTLPPDGTPLRSIAGQFQGPGGEVQRALTRELRLRYCPGSRED